MVMNYILTPNVAVERSALLLRVWGPTFKSQPGYRRSSMFQKYLIFIPLTNFRFHKIVLRNRSTLNYVIVYYATLR
jgi:hypothetical protein